MVAPRLCRGSAYGGLGTLRTVLVVSLLVGSASLVVPVHTAHADGVGVVDSNWCYTGVGSWNAATSTCTMSGTDAFSDLTSLTVPAGTTLVVSTSGATALYVEGTFLNQGKVEVANTAGTGIVISHLDTFTNDGVVLISNQGSGTTGIDSIGGIFVNSAGAMMVISNGAGTGFENNSPSTVTLDNYGWISVANTGGVGLDNVEALYNYASGVIVVANTGGTGLYNHASTTPDFGVISNAGIISVCGGTTTGTVPTSGNPATTCSTSYYNPIPPSAIPALLNITTAGGSPLTGVLVGELGYTRVVYNFPSINQTLLGQELAQGDSSLLPDPVSACSTTAGGHPYIRVSGFFSSWWGGSGTNSTEFIFGDYQSFLTPAQGWPSVPACGS